MPKSSARIGSSGDCRAILTRLFFKVFRRG
jgi:hypothetical protein